MGDLDKDDPGDVVTAEIAYHAWLARHGEPTWASVEAWLAGFETLFDRVSGVVVVGSPDTAGWCDACGRPCRSKAVDRGLGAYEYAGAKGHDSRPAVVSDCCEQTVLDRPPDAVRDYVRKILEAE